MLKCVDGTNKDLWLDLCTGSCTFKPQSCLTAAHLNTRDRPCGMLLPPQQGAAWPRHLRDSHLQQCGVCCVESRVLHLGLRGAAGGCGHSGAHIKQSGLDDLKLRSRGGASRQQQQGKLQRQQHVSCQQYGV